MTNGGDSKIQIKNVNTINIAHEKWLITCLYYLHSFLQNTITQQNWKIASLINNNTIIITCVVIRQVY